MMSDRKILNASQAQIGPSILNADLSELYEESRKLVNNGADYLHLDVMDGNFVPNLTFGHPVVKCLRNKLKTVFFETHMMVKKPQNWIEHMADADVNLYTFHVEPVIDDVAYVCRKIKEAGMLVGLAVKPETNINVIKRNIDLADCVLIMTVEPGFGGQKFMSNMLDKVRFLRNTFPELSIGVDGGVTLETVDACSKAGANMIVSGTGIIQAADQKDVITEMRQHAQNNLSSMKIV